MRAICKTPRWILWLATLWFLPSVGSAHTSPYTELRFDRISVGDGLSNGAVNAITQDARGFMWFGTEDGLNRYDGQRFVIYRPEPDNPNSLVSGNFGSIMQDSRGQLWLGTWGGGLDRLDPETGEFTHFGTGEDGGGGFRGRNIEFVFEDSRGDVWIGTEQSGLNLYLWREDRFQHFPYVAAGEPGDGSQSIKAIEEASDGQIFVGTDAQLLSFELSTGQFTQVEVPGQFAGDYLRIRSLEADRNGGLWVATRGDGLKHLDLDSGTWTEYRHQPGEENGLSENAIARVLADSTGMVWIATYNSGLDRLDPSSGEFRNYDYASEERGESISFRRIDAIYEDRGGVLWFGTRGGGVNKVPVRPRGFKSYRYAPGQSHGLPHTTVRALASQLDEGQSRVWVGTDGGGLVAYDPREGHFDSISRGPAEQAGLSDARVWSTLADREGRVWAGTYAAGLLLLEDGVRSDRIRRYSHDPARPDSLSSNRVQVLFEAMNGDLWIGTRNGLNRLHSLENGGRFQRFSHEADNPQSLSANEITALFGTADGKLLVGTRSGGLNRLDPESGLVRRYPFGTGDAGALTSAYVTSIASSPDGRHWVGTDSGGLHRFDLRNEAFERQESATGQSGLRINSILPEDSGRLWLGTGRGLVRFAPDSGEVMSFGLSDGLATQSYLRGAAVMNRDGEMYFGGLRGLVSFKPGDIFVNHQPPQIVFTSINRFDTGESLLGSITGEDAPRLTFAHDAAFIRIEYAALDFKNPGDNQYAHLLEGVDATWVETGNESSATYSGLAPGNYVFRVKASNNDGFWNEEGISLALTVKPPFWQTWWFRFGLLVLAMLLIYGLHALRTGAIRAQNLKLELLNSRLLEQIAERTRMEGEREALIMELEERNAEMEKFTYTVSHDLKSPLITIKGFLGLLRQDQAEQRADRVTKDIDKIETATTRMNRLLDELLQFSRAGRQKTRIEKLSMQEVVSEALAQVRGELERRDVKVKISGELPDVYGERVRLVEVMQNLVSNAARFMGDQLHPQIEIGVRKVGDETVYFVRDNGIGIEEQHKEMIFGLFERLDAATPGTGIGLALVRRIVEKHNGEVWVESEGPGHGTAFCFTLRLKGEADRVDPSAAA